MYSEKLTDDGAVKYIFENLGSESKIVKLLSLINQGAFVHSVGLYLISRMTGIVLSGIQVLKESVCTDIMTKDVRTPDGWRIGIKLGDAIQVPWSKCFDYVLCIHLYTVDICVRFTTNYAK